MTENILILKSITPKLVEESGWHIGDGSMNYYNNKGYVKGIYQLRGHIEDDRDPYLKVIKPIFKFLYGIDISLRLMPSTRVFGFQIWCNKLVEFKKKLGFPLGKKFDILIPKVFLANDELKKAVIRGIFDTDGCVYLQKKYGKLYPRLEIATISSQLAEQLLIILNKLGLRATKYSYILRGWREIYKISVRGNGMLDKFMKIIKPANPKHVRKYFFHKENF